jgi:hypothetical protein
MTEPNFCIAIPYDKRDGDFRYALREAGAADSSEPPNAASKNRNAIQRVLANVANTEGAFNNWPPYRGAEPKPIYQLYRLAISELRNPLIVCTPLG